MMVLAPLLALMPAAQAKAEITIVGTKTVGEIRPTALAASPTGSQFVVGAEDGTVRIVDAATRLTIRNLPKHPQTVYAVAVSRDGIWVASGDESARVWLDLYRTGTRIREYRSQGRGIQKLSFNTTRQFLASTAKDDTIHVYNLLDEKRTDAASKILGNGANLYGGTFSPATPRVLAAGILSDAGRVYDAPTGKATAFLSYGGSQGTYDVAYNPAGTRIFTAGRDGQTGVWDVKTSKRLAFLKGHTDWITTVAVTPNGKYVATASTDGTVNIYNATTFQRVAQIAQRSSVGSPLCFTADGKYLISADVMGAMTISAISPVQAVPAPVRAPARRPAPRRRG